MYTEFYDRMFIIRKGGPITAARYEGIWSWLYFLLQPTYPISRFVQIKNEIISFLSVFPPILEIVLQNQGCQ